MYAIKERPVAGKDVELVVGEKLVLPPLPLAKVHLISQLADGAPDGKFTESYSETLVLALHASLQRNYPAMPVEYVRDNLDTVNFSSVMEAFNSVNLLQAKAAGAPGE